MYVCVSVCSFLQFFVQELYTHKILLSVDTRVVYGHGGSLLLCLSVKCLFSIVVPLQVNRYKSRGLHRNILI